MSDALPCHICLPVCLWIMNPYSRASKNTSHGNEVLSQDSTHLIQRPCYQWRSVCQDPAGNRTTWRPDYCIETQTAVVWTCVSFIWSGQNHLARHSEGGKKTRQTDEVVGRQQQRTDRLGVHQVPDGSGEQRKMEETGHKIICGAPTTHAVKGMMMTVMMVMSCCNFFLNIIHSLEQTCSAHLTLVCTAQTKIVTDPTTTFQWEALLVVRTIHVYCVTARPITMMILQTEEEES